MWSLLRPNINCTIAGLEEILPEHPDIQPCQALESAEKVFEAMINNFTIFFANISKYECPLPCSQRSYNYKIKYFNRNSWIESQNSTLSQNTAGVNFTIILRSVFCANIQATKSTNLKCKYKKSVH